MNLIESFKLSIHNKDEALFLSLFHDKNISWVGVINDETLNALILKDAKNSQQPKILNGTPQEFISGITNSPVVAEEIFKNIKISTDKEVASVSFDYEFLKDGKLNNYEQKHWQLINTIF